MTIREGTTLVLTDYEVNERRSGDVIRMRIAQLLKHLDGARELSSLTNADLLGYAAARRAEVSNRTRRGASAATINREIAVLRRACTLADVRWPVPAWRKLKESAPRQGFSSAEELQRIVAHLQPTPAAVVRFLFLTGWRRNEALALRWSEVDFEVGEVRLLDGETKNGTGRTFPMYPQLRALLEAQWEGRRGDYVFQREGQPVRSIRMAWRNACKKAGCAGRLLHDFRRTAAMNMIEAGIDRQVAMKLLGHKTESIFNRYRIVTKDALKDAASKLGRRLG